MICYNFYTRLDFFLDYIYYVLSIRGTVLDDCKYILQINMCEDQVNKVKAFKL